MQTHLTVTIPTQDKLKDSNKILNTSSPIDWGDYPGNGQNSVDKKTNFQTTVVSDTKVMIIKHLGSVHLSGKSK